MACRTVPCMCVAINLIFSPLYTKFKKVTNPSVVHYLFRISNCYFRLEHIWMLRTLIELVLVRAMCFLSLCSNALQFSLSSSVDAVVFNGIASGSLMLCHALAFDFVYNIYSLSPKRKISIVMINAKNESGNLRCSPRLFHRKNIRTTIYLIKNNQFI